MGHWRKRDGLLVPQNNETLHVLYPSLNILEVKYATDMANYIKDETYGAGIRRSLHFEAMYYEDNEICNDILARKFLMK